MRVARDGGELVLELDGPERAMLTSLLSQYLELLDDAGDATGAGSDGDPALDRLFPSAYRDDPAAAAEFRQYTHDDLMDRKRSAAIAMRGAIDYADDLRLTPDEAAGWLPPLTELRLVLAERLDIHSDDDPVADGPLGDAYHWLGYVQHTLLEAIDD